jgi:hypothetical protein
MIEPLVGRGIFVAYAISVTVKDYPTPASNTDLIRKLLLAGRHLIILNRNRLFLMQVLPATALPKIKKKY